MSNLGNFPAGWYTHLAPALFDGKLAPSSSHGQIDTDTDDSTDGPESHGQIAAPGASMDASTLGGSLKKGSQSGEARLLGSSLGTTLKDCITFKDVHLIKIVNTL